MAKLWIIYAVCIAAFLVSLPAIAAEPVRVDQGPHWTNAARRAFYSQDQGSQLMPLNWMLALKQANGLPFLYKDLSRCGFLPNPASPAPGLAVGFAINNERGVRMVGMTCAACHTRQIQVDGVAYRLDGRPAFVDNQSFFADIDSAVNKILSASVAFGAFARAVLGPFSRPADRARLRAAVDAWYLRYHTLMSGALPPNPWASAGSMR
jgi:hypothetical protein